MILNKNNNNQGIFLELLAAAKNQTLCFHAVVPTREDLSIDVSITNVGLISTKPE